MSITTILIIAIVVFIIGNIFLKYLIRKKLPLTKDMSNEIISSKIDLLYKKVDYLENKIKK
jgi:hypothetical protein